MVDPTQNPDVAPPGENLRRRRNDLALAALMRLIDYGTFHSSDELLREFLDEAEVLSGSSIGFFHFVEEDQKTVSLQTWSTNTLRHCTAPGAGTHYPIDEAGVWVDCARTGNPVIHNDYAALPGRKGLPDGHVAIVRELVVPVIRDGKLRAILGVGNKATDYDTQDLAVVEQLAKLAWDAIGRRHAEEENQRLQTQFVQSQKMDAIGRLAGGVAHDFNNMLSVILGQVELAQVKAEQSGFLQEELASIQEAATRSVNLTRQLLAFARQQTILPVVLDLNRVVDDMLKMLGRMIGENIKLIWKPGMDLGQVEVDPVQVDQILANLCVNARDAIQGVGSIIIETGNVVFDDTYCETHFEFTPGHYVMLAVSDDGSGMEREIVEHIFEPFFSTKERGRGTGLGLSTVYGIVKQNGGFINVYSELGKGSSFKIYLPRQDNLKPLGAEAAEAGVLEGHGETILLVEDEKMILNFAMKMLENLGYRVLAVESPVRALRMVEEDPTSIDLVISDLVMPEMNGIELMKNVNRLRPDLKAVYMSGYWSDVVARHGLAPDAAFLQKPFSRKDLAARVRETLRQREG